MESATGHPVQGTRASLRLLDPLQRPLAEGWAILTPLALLALAARRRRPLLAAALVTGAAVAAALRDPERQPLISDDALAPADGRVLRIARVKDEYFGQEMIQLTIFLALWHVHVQRAPLAGRLVDARIVPGGFQNALFDVADNNYCQHLYFETQWGPCVVTQIAGLLARRIVRWVEPGERLAAGDRLGMIKFGSRVTLRLPDTCTILVEPGQEVRAGRTQVARR